MSGYYNIKCVKRSGFSDRVEKLVRKEIRVFGVIFVSIACIASLTLKTAKEVRLLGNGCAMAY
ncbi:hypothetical protein [uncultured Helicobacter sp.]|uniref:hypothetical protein n=1 Tax=uncultured Helicobacter sp. TaxID=175537 RepID=UPI0037528992